MRDRARTVFAVLPQPCRTTRDRCAIVALAVLLHSCAARQGPAIDGKQFNEQLDMYLVVRKEAVRQTGTLHVSGDPAVIGRQSDALAEAIQKRRADVQPGNVFTPAIAAEFTYAIARRLEQPDGPNILALIHEVNPAGVQVVVNGRYPGDEPRSTTPPALLAVLPRLPGELEFRFLGRDLVLLDRNARIVVDVLRSALPRHDSARRVPARRLRSPDQRRDIAPRVT